MNYKSLTKTVCSSCGYIQSTLEYRGDCPICDDGIMEAVVLECICGRCWCDDDLEDAQYPNDNDKHLSYSYSSTRRWCYGRDTYDWEDYYKCSCGATLEVSNGW